MMFYDLQSLVAVCLYIVLCKIFFRLVYTDCDMVLTIFGIFKIETMSQNWKSLGCQWITIQNCENDVKLGSKMVDFVRK